MVNHLYYEGQLTPQDDWGTPQDVAERGAASGRGTDSVWIVRHRRDGRLMTGLTRSGAERGPLLVDDDREFYYSIYIYIYIYIYICVYIYIYVYYIILKMGLS